MRDDEKRSIIRDTWFMRGTGHVPYIVEAGKYHTATVEFYEDDAQELAWNEEYNQSLLPVEDIHIPNNKPNVGIGIVAAALGCSYVPNQDADPWVRPLITENSIDVLKNVHRPDLAACQVYLRAFKRIAHFETHSNLPLRLLNVPSPLVTASLIWEYTSFIESTITRPREVHLLMEVVTESIIEYVRAQLGRIKNLYTMGHEPFYIPPEVGLRIHRISCWDMRPRGRSWM